MATLQILGSEEICPLDQSQMGIGRAPDNEIAVEDESVSVYHAMVTIRPSPSDEAIDEYIIEDLDSTNKTWINNMIITNHKLRDGDIIRVGQTRLKFSSREFAPHPQKEFDKTQKLGKNYATGYMLKR